MSKLEQIFRSIFKRRAKSKPDKSEPPKPIEPTRLNTIYSNSDPMAPARLQSWLNNVRDKHHDF